MSDWQLVPKVLTDNMVVAFAEEWYSHRQTIDEPEMESAYEAMLLVAPEVPDPIELLGRAEKMLARAVSRDHWAGDPWKDDALSLMGELRQALSKCTDDRSGCAG